MPLRAVLHPALLPAAAAAALRLAAPVHRAENSPAATADAPSSDRDLTIGSGSGSMVLVRGRAWALLGLARLHLAAPPPGADPTTKRALQAAHLDARAGGRGAAARAAGTQTRLATAVWHMVISWQ